MARSVAWRHTISDAASWHQDQALSATIYILRETGPTGFLLKEEGEAKKVKVFLGDPHSCTCPVFKKERDLCKHICWVLLKKFRVPRQNQITFQLGLVEREINQILRGINAQSCQGGLASRNRYAQNHQSSRSSAAALDRTDGRNLLVQREITEDDVCPICQDELLNAREPVTYCRYGCAKSIHIRCMKVWAEHQRSVGETLIKCPLCREEFGQLEQLQAEYRNASLQKTRSERLDVHTGICCQHCHKSPIQGKCYRCTECFDYCICHACYVTNIHTEHSFKFRQKMNQRWRPAQRGSGTAFPQAVMDDLLGREISDNDYDVLLQLDSDSANKPSNIPEKVIKSFPTETVRQGCSLLNPGVQCRVCLRGYSMGQMLRRLPCRHKFHATCIDPWLLHQHPTCPVDGSVVWTPATSNQTTDSANQNRRGEQSTNQSTGTKDVLDIGIGGTAVKLKRSGDAVSKGRLRSRPRIVELTPSDEIQQLTADFALTGLGIASRAQNSKSSPSEQQRVQSLIRRHSGRNRLLHGDKDCLTGIGATERTDHPTRVPAVNNVRQRLLHNAREGNPSTDEETSSQGNEMEASVLTNRTCNFSQTNQKYNDSVQLQDVLCGSDSNRRVPVPTRLETLTLPGSPEANVSSKPVRTKGAIGRKPPMPSRPLVDRSSAPSIPPHRTSVMTPIGNSRHSNSAPSLRNQNVPLEAEGSISGVTLLPTGRQLTRNVKSTPVSRARTTSQDSRSRLNLPNIDRQQLLDSLFLDASCNSSHSASNTRRTGGQGSSPLRPRVSQALHKNRPVKPDRAFTDGILGNALNSEVT